MDTELRLKSLLVEWGIKQAELAAGVGLSPASISLIVGKDHWPRSLDKEALKGRIEAWLWKRLEADDIYPNEAEKRVLWEATAIATQSEASNEVETLATMEPKTMLSNAEWLTEASKKFFGLTRDPFKNDVEKPEDVYQGGEHSYALASMKDALDGHRIVAIIGESGCGKTTIRRLFAENHSDKNKYSLIVPYMLGADDEGGKDAKPLRGWDIQESIISTLDPKGRIPSSRQARGRAVHDLLRNSMESGRKNVVIIDQAHKLPVRTLVSLKELHDLDEGLRRLTGIILIAQPELGAKLDIRTKLGWNAREFIQRCEIATLQPLDAGGDLEEYLAIKFKRVGKEPQAILEPGVPDAIRAALQIKNGAGEIERSYCLPLAVNNLMAKALNFTARMGKPNRRVGADQINAVKGV